MSCVFQNIDPPPPSPPGECAFVAGGGHTRRVERGVGGQYFGRRKTQLCTLPISNPLWLYRSPIVVIVGREGGLVLAQIVSICLLCRKSAV
jgi:hypothetical protein